MIAILVIICGSNYFLLQLRMDNVLKDDERNNGIKVWVHFKYFVNPFILTYDLRKVSSENSMADVFRVLLQFANKTQFIKFNEIELAYKNKVKFKLNGDYFHELGEGYSYQNPIYTVQQFPENLLNIDGSSSYETWSGGWIAVGAQQMEDANDFHKRWYLDDILK